MIAITGGGTGGHLVIAKAIKEELNRRGIKPIYIGSTAGQDKDWFEADSGFEACYFLPSSGVVNKKGIKKLLSLFSILKSSFACRAIFKKHGVKKVLSVGGYSAAPASFASIFSFIPLFIHEQNAISGKLNMLLKPFCKAFFSAYDKSATITSYPASSAFFEAQKERTELKTIIFLGGSQGAMFINDLAKKMAKELYLNGIFIIHQTGKKEYEALKSFYESEGIPADVFDFSKEIYTKLKSADFAISRSGASTLWELCAAGVPTLFIPFPHAAANHQYHNAKALSDQNLALLLTQEEIEPSTILEKIKTIPLSQVSKQLPKTISPNGTSDIVDYLLNKKL